MADLINISSDHKYIHCHKNDQWGGANYQIMLSPEAIELLNWVETYREQWQVEHRARMQFPLVKDAYDQYVTALSLVKDKVE